MRKYRETMILFALMATAYIVTVEITIMNVALPTLTRDLSATTTQLQWVVDAYNLFLGAFVLAAGSLSDRQGRKGALLLGMGILVVASLAGAWAETSGGLIAARAGMGLGAALMLPTTLSILANAFTERRARARAIGLWGASTGLGVATGPIVGGWLLGRYWWGSIFAFLALLTVAVAALIVVFVPTSRDPKTPPIDWRGLALSIVGFGVLVLGIIEAPQWGWGEISTIACFAIGVMVLLIFIAVQRRTKDPMLDVSLFANMRYTAASCSVAISFFALNGFIFLITQYMQLVKGYSALSMGLRLLPMAGSIGIASIVGAWLAVRIGNKVVVTAGLILFAVGLAWAATNTGSTAYSFMSINIVVLGLGFGLISTPATEAIMGAVAKEKAGVGAAVNDATRLCGATLGVAVIGSMASSLYYNRMGSTVSAALPDSVISASDGSLGGALEAAKDLAAHADSEGARQLSDTATSAFLFSMQGGSLLAAGTVFATAVMAWLLLPARPRTHDSEPGPVEVAQ
ncbi:MFS transporter [Nocardia sp. CDC153]|uniref:MFS transporter n=1 Tax=Nocardia sp. CDC153 TaxID=3112167 RepID=UPI002DB6B407|nr:MFS transporter [Nocardia sp. CDC153]MEC3957773.1 MFS transporter [Nocardia sp. CDC153]